VHILLTANNNKKVIAIAKLEPIAIVVKYVLSDLKDFGNFFRISCTDQFLDLINFCQYSTSASATYSRLS